MFRRESKPQNRIDSLIGATTRIEGNVFFSGGLRVDGAADGCSGYGISSDGSTSITASPAAAGRPVLWDSSESQHRYRDRYWQI